MPKRRLARLNEQIRREISGILRTGVRDPRVGHPTVTGVEVTPDLWMARIFVRPDPTLPELDAGELLAGLERAAPFIRRELGKTLHLRRVPELRFQEDRVWERAARIEEILREVLPPGEESGVQDEEGALPSNEAPPEEVPERGRDSEGDGT